MTFMGLKTTFEIVLFLKRAIIKEWVLRVAYAQTRAVGARFDLGAGQFRLRGPLTCPAFSSHVSSLDLEGEEKERESLLSSVCEEGGGGRSWADLCQPRSVAPNLVPTTVLVVPIRRLRLLPGLPGWAECHCLP